MSDRTEDHSALVTVLQRMQAEGLSTAEMAARVRKRPRTVRQALDHAAGSSTRSVASGTLRPIERVVLEAIDAGDNYGIIASRIGRSGPHTRRIAAYARFKIDGGPLTLE